jgi:hypothetical protein
VEGNQGVNGAASTLLSLRLRLGVCGRQDAKPQALRQKAVSGESRACALFKVPRSAPGASRLPISPECLKRKLFVKSND